MDDAHSAVDEAAERERDQADFEAASHEVDLTLIRWSLGLSTRERLRAATRSGRTLGRFRRVLPSDAS